MPNADYKYLSVSIIFTLGSRWVVLWTNFIGGGWGGGLGGKDEDG